MQIICVRYLDQTLLMEPRELTILVKNCSLYSFLISQLLCDNFIQQVCRNVKKPFNVGRSKEKNVEQAL